MQKNKDHNRLKVSLHGMDERAYKMMASYLELYCKNQAYVVIESESQVEIVDIDSAHSNAILEKRLVQQQPPKPIIVLSVQEVLSDDAIFVKKPIEIPHIVDAIKAVSKKIQKQNKLKKLQESLDSSQHEKLVLNKNLESRTEEIAQVESLVTSQSENSHTENKQKDVLPGLSSPPEKQVKLDVDTIDKEIIKPKPIKTTSVSNREVNTLLNDFLSDKDMPERGKGLEFLPSNNRKTVRYCIQSVRAKLVRDSIISSNKIFIVRMLNVSSKGALIKMKVAINLKGNVTLTIYFDSKHIYSVPAFIVRKESENIYGLQFLSYQHELADYLVENGRSFSIA